jgi:predicted GTPase
LDLLAVFSGGDMYQHYRHEELGRKSTELGIIFDVMVTGVTGAGKSTTLNTIFQKEVAKVGRGVDPETMNLNSYRLNDSFRLWDTPGLGDGKQNDKDHCKSLISLLYKDYGEKHGFIDLVLIILDGSNRDMGTTYKLLNEVVVPNFQKDRVLIAINQADIAMKGHHWNRRDNKPDDVLIEFLEKKSTSVQDRVFEATGIKIKKPIYYSAECNYNINELLDLLINNMPKERRKLTI